MEPSKYKRIRYRLILFGVPTYSIPSVKSGAGAVDTDFLQRSEVVGAETRMTNIDAVGRRTGRLLRQCRREVKARNFSGIFELLDEEPWFIYHPWVEKAFERFRGHPRLRRRNRGRPRTWRKFNPDALVGLVQSLIRSGRVKSREQAFGLIHESGLLSYDTAKRLYHRVQVDRTPRGVSIEFPDEAAYVTAAEAAAERALAEELRPNTSIRRTFQDAEGGPVEILFEGGEQGVGTRDFAIMNRVSVEVQKDR
jgi:hypothetical protein